MPDFPIRSTFFSRRANHLVVVSTAHFPDGEGRSYPFGCGPEEYWETIIWEAYDSGKLAWILGGPIRSEAGPEFALDQHRRILNRARRNVHHRSPRERG